MAMRRLLLLYVAAAAAIELEFDVWQGNYVRVRGKEDEIKCTESDKKAMQLDPDSMLVEGAVEGRPTPLDDYGVSKDDGAAFDRLIYKSGLFVPEVDPCWYVTQDDRDTTTPFAQRKDQYGVRCTGYADAWYKWIGETGFVGVYDKAKTYNGDLPIKDGGVSHLKYAPTGALNLREMGAVNANIDAYPLLSRLNNPPRTTESAPFAAFNKVTRAMWGICGTELCRNLPLFNEVDIDNKPTPFPGMMPTLHPVYDGIPNSESATCGGSTNNCYDNPTWRAERRRDTGNVDSTILETLQEQGRLALKRCPNATEDACCVALEGDEPLSGFRNLPIVSEFEESGRMESKIRWNTVAVHTSFSRGVPDQKFYNRETLKKDLQRREAFLPSLETGNDAYRFTTPAGYQKARNMMELLQQQHTTMLNANGDGSEPTGYIDLPQYSGGYDSDLYDHSSKSSKCLVLRGGYANFRLAHYMEHYYTALTGVEEQRALGQLHVLEEYDREQYAKESNNTGPDAWQKHNEACGNMPGHHCGHGYSCDRPEGTQPHDLIECMPKAVQFKNSEKYRYADTESKLQTLPISGKYHKGGVTNPLTGAASVWPQDDSVDALFKKRVRGRPELAQWAKDNIYYTGNRGRPARTTWPCEWPPPDQAHRYCNQNAESRATPATGFTDAEASGCTWLDATNPRSLGTAQYSCPPSSNLWKGAQSLALFDSGGSEWPPLELFDLDFLYDDEPAYYSGQVTTDEQFKRTAFRDAMRKLGCREATEKMTEFMVANGLESRAEIEDNGFEFYDCNDLEFEHRTRKKFITYGEHYYFHALDYQSWGLPGLTLPYRMSARDIFTYGSGRGFGENFEYSSSTERHPLDAMFSTMLPCRGERGAGRTCYQMKATKYEWLLGAIHASHRNERSTLMYGGEKSGGFHPYDSSSGVLHNQHGPYYLKRDGQIKDRVFLWDIDQTWSFDPNYFLYKGASDERNGYLNGFKDILVNDRVSDTTFEFNYFGDGSWSASNPLVQNLTRWGASDGTSRTNAHAISCWVGFPYPFPFRRHQLTRAQIDNPLSENIMSAGSRTTFKLGSNVDGLFARRACLGQAQIINENGITYWSFSARPNLWPYSTYPMPNTL